MKILNTPNQIAPYQAAVTDIVRQFEQENLDYRSKRLRQWKQQDLYWHNIQYVFWNATDYAPLQSDQDDDVLTRVVNIYKAHGESIIAALGASIPTVRFFPANSQNGADIDTATAWSRIFDIAKKRNRMPLLFIKMLWILYNQDFVAVWNETEKTTKYGTIKREKNKTVSEEQSSYQCPECGAEVMEGMTECPSCGATIIPLQHTEEVKREVFDKYEEIPRVNQRWRAFGPLNVNIPHWTAEPEDIPILILLQDRHISALKKDNQNFRDLITKGSSDEAQERWARAQYYNIQAQANLLTEKKVWIQPSAYEMLDATLRAKFEKDFPTGVCATIIDKDLVVSLCEENLMDRWTISRSPLSRGVHASALGRSLLDIQDITNDLKNLKLQTIEHGISETFTDPEVVDFDAYGKTAAKPGQLIQAKTTPGSNLAKHFFATRPAVLSKEANEFTSELMTDGQFVTGATPSIYGGNLQGSRTVGEYEKSKTAALQRLSIHYSMLKEFIVELGEKTAKLFIAELKEAGQDLEDVEFSQGVFSNNYVFMSQLGGKVGKVEGESSEAFPVSIQQKAAGIFELLKLGNDTISQAILTQPENTYLLKSVFGIPELQVPGEQERTKQWREIQLLIQEQPVALDEMGNMRSSIPVEELDNHDVEFQICLGFLNSDKGQLLKQINIKAYQNVIAHAKEHQAALMAQPVPKEESENGKRRTDANGQ